MKQLNKIAVAVLTYCAVSSVNSAGIESVLDGMFANVTAPNVVSTQLRGSINGGSVYIRSPINNIQPFAIDPPRISAGCGGIDLYLGSFSFITAEKLTQFMRSVAQNAAPLAFKMALNSNFPQLGAVLDKFQSMAQDMNKQQADSCQMAQGLVDAAKNPAESFKRMEETTTAAISSAKGWADNFFSAVTTKQDAPSTETQKVQNLTTAAGKKAVNEQGNITWNALQAQRSTAIVFALTDDDTISKQLIMSMLGTRIVGKPGSAGTDQPTSPPVSANLFLRDLIKPQIQSSGAVSVSMYSCGSDVANCLNPTPSSFATFGVQGYVRTMMYGSATATSPQAGSISHSLLNCSTPTCSLTVAQLRFLNSIGKIPTVALLKRAQKQGSVFSMILPQLVEDMTVEVATIYGRSILHLALSTYSGSNIPKPDNYDATLKGIMDDLTEYEKTSAKNIDRLNATMEFLDSSLRSFRPALVYSR